MIPKDSIVTVDSETYRTDTFCSEDTLQELFSNHGYMSIEGVHRLQDMVEGRIQKGEVWKRLVIRTQHVDTHHRIKSILMIPYPGPWVPSKRKLRIRRGQTK